MQRKLSEFPSKVKWNGLFVGFVDKNVGLTIDRRGSQVCFSGTWICPVRDRDSRVQRKTERDNAGFKESLSGKH